MTMGSQSDNFRDRAETFGERWNRFWFAPAEPLPACVLRIAVGLLALAHFIALSAGLSSWYAADGILPPASVRRLLELTGGDAGVHVSYLTGLSTSSELWLVHGLAIAAAVAFALGLFTRLSGLLTLVALLAYVHRVPQVAGHIEPVLSFLLLYLCIAPSGACLSLDRRLFGSAKKRSFLALLMGSDEPTVAANLGLRLIQVHLAMFYAMLGLTKLYGDAWWDGNAIWLLLAQTQSRPLDLTGLRRAGQLGEYFLNFWTHSIVYFELAFGVLIWSRLGRPVLLVLSVVAWISIILATGQLLFALTMLAAGLAFVPPGMLRRLVGTRAAVSLPASPAAAMS
jgi:hypothetical protein